MITVMGATGQHRRRHRPPPARRRRARPGARPVGTTGWPAWRDAGAEPLPVDADRRRSTSPRRSAAPTPSTCCCRRTGGARLARPPWPGSARRSSPPSRAAGVPHVVAVSAVGADLPTARGSSPACTPRSSVCETSPTWPTCSLCGPARYFENSYGRLPSSPSEGVMADSVAPDAPLPMVATRDVGAAAAAALRSRDWTGFAVRELLGPRDLTYAEVARDHRRGASAVPTSRTCRCPTTTWGRPDRRRLVARRRPPAGRDDAGVQRRAGRGPRPPHPGVDAAATRFEDFATELAAAYHGAAPAVTA